MIDSPTDKLATESQTLKPGTRGESVDRSPFVNGVEETAPEKPSSASRRLSVRHNFAWTLAGNLTFALCQWAVIVLLAKLSNAEMVGRFALAFAVAYPITYVAHMQLRVIYVTDLKGNYPAAKVLGLRLMLSAIAITVLLITCFVAGYSLQESEVIFVIGLAQLVDCVSENYFAIAQRHERMDRIAQSQMMRSLLSLSAVASIVYFTHNLLWGVAGYVMARGTVLFTYDAGHGTFTLGSTTRNIPTYAQRLSPQWDFRKQFQLLWVALPLGAVTILGSLNSNMPRYFLEKSDGPREVGIYSALNYLPTAALLISSALGYAAFARLSKLYFEGDLRNFRIVLGKAIAVCASLGVCGLLGGALLGRQVLTLLYRPEYAEHVDLLMLLLTVGAIGCVASCMGCAMSAASQFRVQVPLFLAVTGTSFVACHFLIPRYGLRGGAFASLVAMCVQFLGTAIVIYRALAKRAEEMKVGVAIGIEPALESQ